MEINSANVHGGGHVVFTIVWGLGATVAGVLLLLNFRGIRDRSIMNTVESSGLLKRLPPWRWLAEPKNRSARVTVGAWIASLVFTIVGPIVTVSGIREALRPGFVFHAFAPSWHTPLPVAVIAGVISVASLWKDWRQYRNVGGAAETPSRSTTVVGALGTAIATAGFVAGYLVPTLIGTLAFGGAQLASVMTTSADQPN